MLNSILTTTPEALDFSQFLLCSVASVLSGAVIALIHRWKSFCSSNFMGTLALLPLIVQIVIMLVNGNLGTGVAVMGAFSLVRFRSVPGDSREICSIFLAMAAGISTGMGYIGIALFLLLAYALLSLLQTMFSLNGRQDMEKSLRVTIPENLDYTEIFDDIFKKYTVKASLQRVKTVNMGSLYELSYSVWLRDKKKEKEMLDQIRCRNGNLTVICGRTAADREML